jgi:hypothetical protein
MGIRWKQRKVLWIEFHSMEFLADLVVFETLNTYAPLIINSKD